MVTTQKIPQSCDVLVVGGGINGAGIARDLAGRGYQVVLCDKDDLAQHTSSCSTKLIHGGLRYLEHGALGLVRKALAEREVLLNLAPHIMWPLRFVMPHHPDMRPAWMIRAGLFLYDHLASRKRLQGSSSIALRQHVAGQPLKSSYTKGFVYSDGWVEDARLVVLNAMDAAERGATILPRWRCQHAQRSAQHWQVLLQNRAGQRHEVTARALVNATGPWAARFLNSQAQLPCAHALRLVKGSHIVVPKLFDHDHAYIFQNPDGRIVFAIPYEQHFTLIGTTDVEHQGAVGKVHIDEAEITYLCEQVSRYFDKPVRPEDVVWSYAGVRPLLQDAAGNPAAATRDYRLELNATQAPIVTVWGGKLTTYRKLAEEAVNQLVPLLKTIAAPQHGAWTHRQPLPGGDVNIDPATLATPLHQRWARAYGSRMQVLLQHQTQATLGNEVAPGLFEAELHYLHEFEWAQNADDVLWRRSKLGLHFNAAQRDVVAQWCHAHWD
jgi:glycerol-3-phosphate dehydrogenase